MHAKQLNHFKLLWSWNWVFSQEILSRSFVFLSFISLTFQLQHVDGDCISRKVFLDANPQSNHRKTQEKLLLNSLKHTSWLCTHNNNTHLSHTITKPESHGVTRHVSICQSFKNDQSSSVSLWSLLKIHHPSPSLLANPPKRSNNRWVSSSLGVGWKGREREDRGMKG